MAILLFLVEFRTKDKELGASHCNEQKRCSLTIPWQEVSAIHRSGKQYRSWNWFTAQRETLVSIHLNRKGKFGKNQALVFMVPGTTNVDDFILRIGNQYLSRFEPDWKETIEQ